MELDDLKKDWDIIGKDAKKLDENEIKAFLHTSSQSPLVKIRKNIIAELLSILPVLIGFYVYVFLKNSHSDLFFIGLGVLTAITLFLILIVLPRLYMRTKRNNLNKSISYSLQQNIDDLKNDLDFYEKVMLFLYVPACFAGFALSEFFDYKIAIIFLLFFPVYYFFVKKWINYFYGRYIEELEEMELELEE